jgi:hypothetical protein
MIEREAAGLNRPSEHLQLRSCAGICMTRDTFRCAAPNKGLSHPMHLRCCRSIHRRYSRVALRRAPLDPSPSPHLSGAGYGVSLERGAISRDRFLSSTPSSHARPTRRHEQKARGGLSQCPVERLPLARNQFQVRREPHCTNLPPSTATK